MSTVVPSFPTAASSISFVFSPSASSVGRPRSGSVTDDVGTYHTVFLTSRKQPCRMSSSILVFISRSHSMYNSAPLASAAAASPNRFGRGHTVTWILESFFWSSVRRSLGMRLMSDPPSAQITLVQVPPKTVLIAVVDSFMFWL